MSFDDDEYETDPGPQAEYEAYANTLCRGCHHLRRFHRDAGLDNPDHPTMPCWDRDVDQNDEERTVECMCLGWWEPGEPCPYETEEYLSSAAPRWADMTEEERQRAWEVGQSVQGKGAYQLDKEAVEELYAQSFKLDEWPGEDKPITPEELGSVLRRSSEVMGQVRDERRKEAIDFFLGLTNELAHEFDASDEEIRERYDNTYAALRALGVTDGELPPR